MALGVGMRAEEDEENVLAAYGLTTHPVAIGNFTTVALDHGIGVMNPGGILFAPDRVIQKGGWR
jgi:hypothetical protein